MKKFIGIIALISLAGMAKASLNAYDPFNYSTLNNGTAATGTGFTGNWSCGAAGSMVTGLAYSGLPSANKALNSGRQPPIRQLCQSALQRNQVDQFFVYGLRQHGRKH